MGIFGAVRFLQTLLLFLNVQHRIIMLIFVTQIMDHYSHTVWHGDWQPGILWQQIWKRSVPAMYIYI